MIADWGLQALHLSLADFKINALAPQHQKMWQELQYLLENAPKVSHLECAENKQSLMERYPAFKENINFLQRVLDNYKQILTGKSSILHLLFAGGGFETISNLYEKSPLCAHCNRLTAEVVSGLVKSPVTILELGAGIGATTRQLLPRINANCLRYDYTDLSRAFLAYGRNNFFENYSFMAFSLFDINFPFDQQNKQIEQYDIILAADVLHNAHDICAMLSDLYQLIKPGGHLVINETTPKSNYSTLIYGLTPGWWGFQDPQHRIPGSPLLSVSVWQELLVKAGFQVDQTVDEKLGQVVLAVSRA